MCWGQGQGQGWSLQSVPAWAPPSARLGQRVLTLGPVGSTPVALSMCASGHGAGAGTSQFCAFSQQGAPPGDWRTAGSLQSGDWTVYGNSGGRAPAARNVCSLFAAQSPPGPVPRPGQACLPQQARGQLPGLERGLAWALGGAGARARGAFSSLFLERDEDPREVTPLIGRKRGSFPVRHTDPDGKAGPLIVSTGRRGEGAT